MPGRWLRLRLSRRVERVCANTRFEAKMEGGMDLVVEAVRQPVNVHCQHGRASSEDLIIRRCSPRFRLAGRLDSTVNFQRKPGHLLQSSQLG